MKKILLLLSLVILSAAYLHAEFQQRPVYVIPVDTEIDNSAFHHFRTALNDAREKNASLILLHLNTYGGALDAADSIRTAIMKLDMPTVAFVDVNAASAGALIALACDSVYMAPGASMGSATVVNSQGDPMPEKYQSFMSTMMRATAEHHGKKMEGDSLIWRRDPATAASMVNPEVSVSLTGAKAVACGYADGIAANIDDVLAYLNMAGTPVCYYRSTLTDDIVGFLANAGVRAMLVMLILAGIYMEMHTPGLGFAAAVASVAAFLYFLPIFITGTVPAWVILCLICGIILIALEIFVIPGFGFCGVSGIIAIVAACVGAATANDTVTGFDLSAIGQALTVVGIGSVLAIILIWYLTSSKGPGFIRRHSELMTELKSSEGFIGVDMTPSKYVGLTGRSVTVLRPAGKAEINGEILDAVSTGEFIQPGRLIKVVKYENAQIYVTEI